MKVVKMVLAALVVVVMVINSVLSWMLGEWVKLTTSAFVALLDDETKAHFVRGAETGFSERMEKDAQYLKGLNS